MIATQAKINELIMSNDVIEQVIEAAGAAIAEGDAQTAFQVFAAAEKIRWAS